MSLHSPKPHLHPAFSFQPYGWANSLTSILSVTNCSTTQNLAPCHCLVSVKVNTRPSLAHGKPPSALTGDFFFAEPQLFTAIVDGGIRIERVGCTLDTRDIAEVKSSNIYPVDVSSHKKIRIPFHQLTVPYHHCLLSSIFFNTVAQSTCQANSFPIHISALHFYLSIFTSNSNQFHQYEVLHPFRRWVSLLSGNSNLSRMRASPPSDSISNCLRDNL